MSCSVSTWQLEATDRELVVINGHGFIQSPSVPLSASSKRLLSFPWGSLLQESLLEGMNSRCFAGRRGNSEKNSRWAR